jgi:two-component system chemotaxis response regulator CheY
MTAATVCGFQEEVMNKRILTVDDSASMRQMVNFTLTAAGYDVTEAEDGLEALGKLNGEAVNMIIADINMPNMDGIELIRKVRTHDAYKFIPIIILTTESQSDLKQQGKAAGATGWIVKPFTPSQLVSVVKKVLG